ncbi:hypothetical protein ACQHGV_05695 [Sphingomonas pseudosanguinis]|uniref:hypothetical protein n=1 Tax=Sphingomonas pseudosanguinis TaxID=413712 RepID=UPI003F83F3C3
MATTDIVVVGRRITSGGVLQENSRVIRDTNSPVEGGSGGGDGVQPEPNVFTASVNVLVDDPNNREKALEAAKNVAAAVAQIIEGGSKLPYDTLIPLPNGKTMKVGDLVNLAKSTKFVVTDRQPPANRLNGGVGSADAPNKTDTLQFGSFVEGLEFNTYSAPGYQGQGMLGIMLHELGHMSPEGYANFLLESKAHTREITVHRLPQNPFRNSDYHKDNEAFAHQFAISAGRVLNIELGIYDNYNKPPVPYSSAEGVKRRREEENGW